MTCIKRAIQVSLKLNKRPSSRRGNLLNVRKCICILCNIMILLSVFWTLGQLLSKWDNCVKTQVLLIPRTCHPEASCSCSSPACYHSTWFSWYDSSVLLEKMNNAALYIIIWETIPLTGELSTERWMANATSYQRMSESIGLFLNDSLKKISLEQRGHIVWIPNSVSKAWLLWMSGHFSFLGQGEKRVKRHWEKKALLFQNPPLPAAPPTMTKMKWPTPIFTEEQMKLKGESKGREKEAKWWEICSDSAQWF